MDPHFEPPEQEQGCRIPCVDCTILEEYATPCPTCGGAGELFQTAQMCDQETQQAYGRLARDRHAEALEGISGAPEDLQLWRDLAGLLRDFLSQTLIYGVAWAAGFRSVDVPEEERSARAMIEALQLELKKQFFAARARSQAGI